MLHKLTRRFSLILLIGFAVNKNNRLSAHALLSPATLAKVRAAMTTTTESQTNVAKAYEACDLWDNLFATADALPAPVQAVSFVLHAACLARVGRDEDAEEVYRRVCLDNAAAQLLLEPKTLQDAIVGRASALQRLMRYDEAITQFLGGNTDRSTLGAVTCCMRLGELNRAIRILQERQRLTSEGDSRAKELRATLAVLKYLTEDSGDSSMDRTVLTEAAPESPLFQWLLLQTSDTSKSDLVAATKEHLIDNYNVLQLAAINQCPFDDPLLLNLDDKIKLHQLLAKSNLPFWPEGYILPDELDSFQQRHVDNSDEKRTRNNWILKSRAGYGSHGNEITSAARVVETTFTRKATSEQRLCQRLVNPPLLLLDGRKFSMRVYVYAFRDDIYLSNRGLVKLASRVYDGNEQDVVDDRMYMTNSGREDTMLQYDFEYLRDAFRDAGWSYDAFWNKIRKAVATTMKYYHDEKSNSDRLQLLGIPKILGFDFMASIDNNNNLHEPMLLEVNRFPGLEARGDGDEEVKRIVVREAWICAADRMAVPTNKGDGSTKSVAASYEKLLV